MSLTAPHTASSIILGTILPLNPLSTSDQQHTRRKWWGFVLSLSGWGSAHPQTTRMLAMSRCNHALNTGLKRSIYQLVFFFFTPLQSVVSHGRKLSQSPHTQRRDIYLFRLHRRGKVLCWQEGIHNQLYGVYLSSAVVGFES